MAHSCAPEDVSHGLISAEGVDSTGDIFPEEIGDLDYRGYGWGV